MNTENLLTKAVSQEVIRLAHKYGLDSVALVEIITEWNQWVTDKLQDSIWIHRN